MKKVIGLFMAFVMLISITAGIDMSASAATQKAMWFMNDLKITQAPGGNYSHKGTQNFDVVGVKNNNIFAPFDCKVVKIHSGYNYGNTVIIESTSKVDYADGTVDYMTMCFAHDNDISNLSVGKKISQGQVFYQTGTYGNVTGRHSHVTVIRGKYKNDMWTKNSYGNYCSPNAINPAKALFISGNTNVVDTKGLSFKKISASITKPSVTVKAVSNITSSSAQVNFTANNPSKVTIKTVGVQVRKKGTSNWTTKSEAMNPNYVNATSTPMWWTIGKGKEVNMTLNAGTTYEYRAYVVYNGTNYYSSVNTFTTTGHTHTYNSGKVTKAATTSSAGTITYTCTKCSATKTVAIAKISTTVLSKTSYTYDGKQKNPTVTIKDANGKVLRNSTDYTLTYSSGRTNAGTYYVTVSYKGNYSGSTKLSFKVIQQIPSRCTPKLSKTSYTYDGNQKNPTVTIKDVCNNTLVKGRDYTLTYDSGRTNVGTYDVKITYIGNYSGTDTVSFKVIKQISSRCTAKLSTTATYYNGSVKTPSVTIKDVCGNTLKKGTDYTVSYATGRKNVGRYAVKVTYKGNYNGSQTLYFNVIPRGVSKISKISAKSKGFTVQWTRQTTQTTGYQIQYSTSSSFKNAKTITMPKSSYYAKKITGLSGNKKYYVRVRTYKTTKFNGKNYNIYSYWCATKNITTKR